MYSNFGIVICSRTDSSRIPKKVFTKINGEMIITHLVKRLLNLNIRIYIAIPQEQMKEYLFLLEYKNVYLYPSKHDKDPLARMTECAIENKIHHVIRITHDKILISEKDIKHAVSEYLKNASDYLYGSKFIDGTGFEIISANRLIEASKKYNNVEFISYPIRELAKAIYNFNPKHPIGDYRFLIDYQEDIKLFEVIFSQLGSEASIHEITDYLNSNVMLKKINHLPKLTIYTCVYNGSEYIERCMKSVSMQKDFKNFEYIIIDDCSTDKTCELVSKFCLQYPNTKWIRNEKNLGLASSSNVALTQAKGKYLVRIDADDFFISIDSCNDLIHKIEDLDCEAVYPDNYFGEYNTIQKGNDDHHVGGAIFERKAINYIKFMDGLRHYEGLDFFTRAKDRIKIGYLKKPIFMYTQRDGSLSKSSIKKRKIIKEKIENRDGLDEYCLGELD